MPLVYYSVQYKGSLVEVGRRPGKGWLFIHRQSYTHWVAMHQHQRDRPKPFMHSMLLPNHLYSCLASVKSFGPCRLMLIFVKGTEMLSTFHALHNYFHHISIRKGIWGWPPGKRNVWLKNRRRETRKGWISIDRAAIHCGLPSISAKVQPLREDLGKKNSHSKGICSNSISTPPPPLKQTDAL